MEVGDKCYINGVSSMESFLLYKNLQNKYPSLICPCHIPNTQQLEIKAFIGKTSVVVSFSDSPSNMSIIKISDLRFPKYD